MKIDISKKKEYIECGDLVYSKMLEKYGFIAHIENSYCFIEKTHFDNWSDSYEELSELIHKVDLELIAKNKDLRISLKGV